MVTKLQKIISKIEKRHSKKIDLSLDRTFNLLNKLGNPQNKIKNVVTVVGTNAKASMATALSTILKESGYKYNLYTSPHLQSYTERFVFNNKEINENDLAILLEDIDKILGDDNATVFEILTCAHFCILSIQMRRKRCNSMVSAIVIIAGWTLHECDFRPTADDRSAL